MFNNFLFRVVYIYTHARMTIDKCFYHAVKRFRRVKLSKFNRLINVPFFIFPVFAQLTKSSHYPFFEAEMFQ